jgi:RNA polymerase sigma factor (sigma-70 family)
MPLQGAEHLARGGTFNTTHWSVVLAAGQTTSPQSATALEKLCSTYWYPLYSFIRRQGQSHEDAQDLTQGFFARLLRKDYLAKVNSDRGKFRTFLLGSVKNFMVNEWRRAARLKRGGDHQFVSLDAEAAAGRYAAEPLSQAPPESLFERQWAVALIEQAFAILRVEYVAMQKGAILDELRGFIWGEKSAASYAEIGARLNIPEGTVKVSVHRLRQRFREVLREQVGQTVSDAAEVDGELRHLIAVLS